MAPPIPANRIIAQASANNDGDKFWDDQAPPPPAKTAAESPPPPVAAPEAKPQGVAPKPNEVKVEKPKVEESQVTTSPTVWNRLHLVLSGGWNFGGRIKPNVSPFDVAAPGYSGGTFGVQPSFRVFERPNADVRVGATVQYSVLNVANSEVAPDSQLRVLVLGALVEANWILNPNIALGGNVGIGAITPMSGNADTGAPFSALLGFGDSLFYFGGQIFVSLFRQVVRVGVSFDVAGGDITISTGSGNPDLKAKIDPQVKIFAGVDVFQGIRLLQK